MAKLKRIPTDMVEDRASGKKLDKLLSEKNLFVSVAKYDNNLNTALQNEMFVSLPEGTFSVSPLTRLLLAGKKIKGSGKRTVLQFTGDVICFDMASIQDCFIEDVSVKVDATNTKDVFKLSAPSATGESIKNRIKNVWIDTVDGTQGQYTGIRLLSNVAGLYQNEVLDPSIENCKNGIVLEAVGNGAWTTHNLITNPYIKKFTDKAIDFIENPMTTVINNIVSSPRIVDWTQENIERTGIRVSGMSNTITNMEIFNDGQYGTFNALDFTDTGIRSYSNTFIGGGAEGLIKNEQNIHNHLFDVNLVKRKNALDTNPSSDPIRIAKTSVSNLIKNYNFLNGVSPWTSQNLTSAVSASANKEYHSKKVVLTKTAASAKFYLNLPKPDLFVGKYVTFTAAIKSSVKAFVVIDEGTPGFLRGLYHTGGGGTELLSVSKNIAGGGVVQVAVCFDDSVANGSTLTIEWVCANYGRMSPSVPLPSQPNYVSKNKGSVTVAAGQSNAVITHGLDVTPNPEDVTITPLSWWDTATGELQWWVTEVGATTFKLQLSKVAPTGGWTVGWKVEV